MEEPAQPTAGPNEMKSWNEVVNALENAESPPVLSAGDIADRTGLSRQTVYNRLEDLEDDDQVTIRNNKRSGSKVYWLPERNSQANWGVDLVTTTAMYSSATSKLPSLSLPSMKLLPLAAFFSFITFYGIVWGIPLLGWAIFTWLYVYDANWQNWHPREWGVPETSWVFVQVIGLQLILASSILSRTFLGVGPGIGVAPNLETGVDVTLRLFLANGGFILGIAGTYGLERLKLSNAKTSVKRANAS